MHQNDDSPEEHREGSFRLSKLLVTLLLNAALTTATMLWLAGQLAAPLAWVAAGNNEYSLQFDREGWILQQSSTLHHTIFHKSGTGISFQHRKTSSQTAATSWNEVLSDSNPRYPLPGLILASGARFQIIALRHWLVVMSVLTIWTSWHYWLPATRTSQQPSATNSFDTE